MIRLQQRQQQRKREAKNSKKSGKRAAQAHKIRPSEAVIPISTTPIQFLYLSVSATVKKNEFQIHSSQTYHGRCS